MICNKCKNKFEYDEGEKDVCYECIEELNSQQTSSTGDREVSHNKEVVPSYGLSADNIQKGCNKMFKPFGDSKEETSWKCGDKWNGESLLCSDCKKLNEQKGDDK